MAPVAYLPTRPDLRLMKQNTYRCGNEQKDWKPLPTIDFTVRGKEGICLTDAANLHFSDLDGRDDLMFRDTGIGNSVSCRIEVRGHFPIGFRCCLVIHSISSWDIVRVVSSWGRCVEWISLRYARGVVIPLIDRDEEAQERARPNYEAKIGTRCY